MQMLHVLGMLVWKTGPLPHAKNSKLAQMVSKKAPKDTSRQP